MRGQDLAAALLDAAKAAGAEAADAMVSEGVAVDVAVREGAMEEAQGEEGVDYGLRVLIGQRQASVSASDPSLTVLKELAERAVAMAKAAPEDPWCGLAERAQLAEETPDLDLVDAAPDPSPEALKDMALTAEAAALSVGDVAQVESARAGHQRVTTTLATSHGFSGSYAKTFRAVSVSAVAGEGLGMETDYDTASRLWFEDLPDPAEIGARAGRRAAERLNPGKAKTGAFPVLFDERVSRSLIAHILNAISGAAVNRGSTWLRDKMGEAVLPKGFDLLDEPHRLRIGGSRPFDGEGMTLSRRALISDGVLMGWRMDGAAARQLGLAAPGGARRGIGGPPAPGHSNIRLTEGEKSRDQLIAEMGEGLIVTSLIGSSVNPTTGGYSRGASGFWVEGGEISHPVNELTIAGELPDFMMGLTAANDADQAKSTVVPSLLVEGLTIASG